MGQGPDWQIEWQVGFYSIADTNGIRICRPSFARLPPSCCSCRFQQMSLRSCSSRSDSRSYAVEMPDEMDTIMFEVIVADGCESLIPVINGQRLTDLVHALERLNTWSEQDSYMGLVPGNYNFGPMRWHYLGLGGSTGLDVGALKGSGMPVLGCECGEWGCWPILVTVVADENIVEWRTFVQPYRPERDYIGIGPFRFSRAQFDDSAALLP